MNKRTNIGLAVIAYVTLACAIVACKVESGHLTPADQTELEARQKDQADAKASGDIEKQRAADEALAAFEAKVLKERAGPMVALAAAINPALAPYADLLYAFVPLLGSRGRKNAASVVNNLNPFTKDDEGKRIDAIEAIKDLGRYTGILHTSEETKAVANGTLIAVSPTTLQNAQVIK